MSLQKMLKDFDFERLAGSAGEAKAREIIINYLRNLGFDPQVEPFTIKGFSSGTADIFVGSYHFEATPFGLCTDVEIEAELVFLENADILKHNPGIYEDKIVLYYHHQTRLYELNEFTKVRAFIGISAPGKKSYSYSHRQNCEDDAYVPSVMMRYDDAEKLIKHSGKQVKLMISQKRESLLAHNLILDIKGSSNEKNLTLLVGHYDTVARSHGACDNAAGSIALLKAAQHFAKHPPRRDLRIIWFSGEEMGLLGSYAYAQAHADEIQKRLRSVINVDLAGDPIGRNQLIVLGTKELMGYSAGILKENGLLFCESLGIYSSDCMPFSVFEVPSLNLARTGGKALNFGHTADDTYKNTSEYGLQDIVRATIVLLDHILNAAIYPINKEIDDSLRDKIESYLWQSTLQKPELKWRERYRK